jgi:hypothetical protein
MDKVYRERSNGKWEYWIYSDGDRIMVSHDWAYRELQADRIVLIDIK